MKKIIILIALIIISLTANSQTSNVSDFDRNLSVYYPISSNTVDGYPYNVSLEYSANVPVIYLEEYWKDTIQSTDVKRDGWKFKSATKPFWIMGINGYAIQVFSYGPSPALSKRTLNAGTKEFWDELGDDWISVLGEGSDRLNNSEEHSDFAWIIHGYDISNRLYQIDEDGDQDIIKILKSNGTIVELRNNTSYNSSTMTEYDEELYSGTYYVNDMNSNAFAEVEIDTSWWPEYYKKHAPYGDERVRYMPRIMRYFPGDGLEYVYKEHIAPYGARMFTNTMSDDDFLNYKVPFTTFYLSEINSPNSSITEVERQYHKFDTTNQIFRGIPFVEKFKYHKIKHDVYNIIIESYDTQVYMNYKSWSNHSKLWIYGDTLNHWQDSVPYNYYKGNPRYHLYDNAEEELNRTYDYTYGYNKRSNNYDKGNSIYNYYLNKITNSEGDGVEFKYKEKSLDVERTSQDMESHYMDSIIYKDRIEVYEYDQNGGQFIPEDNTDKIKIYDVNLFNQVKKKTVYEKSAGGNTKNIVQHFEYLPSEDKDSVAYTKVRTVDVITSDTVTKEKTYVLVEEDPIFAHPHQGYLNPTISTFEVTKDKFKSKGKEIITDFKYGNFKDSTGSKFNSKYKRFLTESTKQFISGDFDPIVEKKKYSYEFEEIALFDNSDTLKNSFGRVPKKITISSLNPNNTISDELLYKRETEYLNLPYFIAPVPRLDSVWNEEESIKATIIKQFFENEKTTVNIFDTTTNDKPVHVAPQYFLVKKETFFDKHDSIVGGRINNFEENFFIPPTSSHLPESPRGALLSDSVFGKNYEDVKLVNNYSYKTGWYRNFLTSVTNANGVISKLYYDYSNFDDELTGTYHLNNKGVTSGDIYSEYHQFETPLVTENSVRKYSSSGALESTVLRNVVELNKQGKIAKVIDENSNIYQTYYNRLNDLSYVWHPYDFPPGDGAGNSFDTPWTFEFDCNKLINIYSNIKRRNDSLDRVGKEIFHTHKEDEVYYDESLYVGTKFSKSTPIIDEYIDSSSSNSEKITTETYVSYFSYKADSLDNVYNRPLDSLQLTFDVIGASFNNFMHLTIEAERFNFKKRIILGSEMLAYDSTATQPVDDPEPVQRLSVEITYLIDSIQSMSHGEIVEFKVSSSSTEGWLELLKPCMKTKETNPNSGKGHFSDYTYHFEYDYDENRVEMYSKIDDAHNTYNTDWSGTWDDYDGRYRRMDAHSGLYGRTKKADVFVGHPDSPERIDTFSTQYSGFSSPLETYDAYGNLTEFSQSNSDIYSEVTYPNNSTVESYTTYDYPYNLVPSYDSTDQDFMGFAKKVTTVDEKGLKSMAYYDLLGKMRLKIIDSVNTYKLTRFNYTDLGKIKEIIQENLDTTRYWYDDYGRLKYKYKTEIGYVSYQYDEFGRLRFTQNAMQSANDKLNYYQYDDLGRITILGEAAIDVESQDSTIAEPVYNEYDDVVFERLSDNLNPNVLYYRDYGVTDGGVLSLNSTLIDGSLTYSSLNIDTLSIINGYNIFDSHDSLEGPFIKHNYVYGLDATVHADYRDFEDIGEHPEYVRKAIYYDEYPYTVGNIWGGLPPKTTIDSITPSIGSNGIGKPIAIAYRDIDGEALNYTTFGYDARGRVTTLLRYNEYLGFDGVFYEYNSANQIIKEVSADPLKQMVTWYSYDQTGRMDSIWVTLDSTGSGFGVNELKAVNGLNKDEDADLAFKYNKNGMTDTIIYNKVDVIQSINYSNRGWIDSLVVSRNSDEVLKAVFSRDVNGMIDNQTVNYWTKDPLSVDYDYDDYYRLEQFESFIDGTSNKIESYEYDEMDNRTKKTNSIVTNYNYGVGENSNTLQSFAQVGSSDITEYSYNEIGGVKSVENFNAGTMVRELEEEFDYLSNGLIKFYTEHVDTAYTYNSLCREPETYTKGENTWMYRYNEGGQLESKRLYQSDSSDLCATHSWVYNKIGAYGEVKAVYHGRQRAGGGRNVTFYVDKYLTANGLMEIYPNGTKEYNILDNKNSTRMKIKDNDTSLVFMDYEPYGENRLHSTDDIPKRGYMGNNKSSEHGYYNMGARLYNSNTGRFMSVDPLMELFVEHNAYHYSYNNPVMFSDPSGLAPEKESKVQAGGSDHISGSVSGGRWVTEVVEGDPIRIQFGINMDTAPAKVIERATYYETRTWVPSGGGGGGVSGNSNVRGGATGYDFNSDNGLRKPNSIKGRWRPENKSYSVGTSFAHQTGFEGQLVDNNVANNLGIGGNIARITNILNDLGLVNEFNILNDYSKQKNVEVGGLLVLSEGNYTIEEFIFANTKFGISLPETRKNFRNIFIGRLHVHTSQKPFSGGDIQYFSGLSNSKEGIFTAILSENHIFVIFVTNPEKAINNFDNEEFINSFNNTFMGDESLDYHIYRLNRLINSYNSGLHFFYINRKVFK